MIRFAVTRLIPIMVEHRRAILESIDRAKADHLDGPSEIVFDDILEGLVRMYRLSAGTRWSYWCCGDEQADQLRQRMEACERVAAAPGFAEPPHVERFVTHCHHAAERQIKAIHRAAASPGLTKAMRTWLYEFR